MFSLIEPQYKPLIQLWQQQNSIDQGNTTNVSYELEWRFGSILQSKTQRNEGKGNQNLGDKTRPSGFESNVDKNNFVLIFNRLNQQRLTQNSDVQEKVIRIEKTIFEDSLFEEQSSKKQTRVRQIIPQNDGKQAQPNNINPSSSTTKQIQQIQQTQQTTQNKDSEMNDTKSKSSTVVTPAPTSSNPSVVEIIQKQRIGNIDSLGLGSMVDLRLSLKSETHINAKEWEQNKNKSKLVKSRTQIRHSIYTFDGFRIDFSEANTQANLSAADPIKTYEIEIECLNHLTPIKTLLSGLEFWLDTLIPPQETDQKGPLFLFENRVVESATAQSATTSATSKFNGKFSRLLFVSPFRS